MVTVDPDASKTRGTSRQLAVDLWEIARPGLFLVSLVPFYLGYLLAGRQLVFGQHECLGSAGGCGPALASGLIGLIVWGPLVWLAVLAINDAYDLEGDLLNPRKDTPLTSGRLSVRGAKIAAYLAAAGALSLSYAVRPGLALATLGFLVCGWVYSVPPLKCKNRPGLDVVSNCVALGAFPVLGGWAVARPLSEFPWIVIMALLLVQIALYMPTMIGDYETDRDSGSMTTAVWVGPSRTYQIGLVSWIGYWVLTVVLAARGQVIPHRMLWIQAASSPIFVWLYHRYLSQAREPHDIARGMLLVGKLFLLPSLVFALLYTGTI